MLYIHNMRRSVLLILFGLALGTKGQEGMTKRELFGLLKTVPPDSTRIDAYNELVWPVYSFDAPDSSIYFARKAIRLGTATGDKLRLSITHRRLGITYINLGELQKAIGHQEESYRLSEELGYRKGMLLALNNIGVAYLNGEVLGTALGYFHRSLKLMQEINDYSSAFNIYTNCGMIYRRTGDPEKSKEFFFRAKEHAERQGEPEMLLIANSNLSTAYRILGQMDSSATYLNESARYLDDNTSNNTRFKYYLTRALLRSAQGHNDEALSDFIAMQPLASVLNDEITLLINIAEEHLKTGNRKQALAFFNKAYALSEDNRLYSNLEYVSLALANLHESQGNIGKFRHYIRKHLAFSDSTERVNRIQHIQRQQLEFDYRTKHLSDSLTFLQKEKLSKLELAAAEDNLLRARNTRALLICIVVILTATAFFVLNRFIVVRRQKQIIESQKALVETKNEEILDSITYARRLQAAILPQMSEIRKYTDAAVLFMPKDIIGGDFYFFERHKNKLYFAVCDCTGHGVPGALMSVVCYEALEKSIRAFRLRDPGSILDRSRALIIENLNASAQNIKDGMDCSLLVIDQLKNSVQWAGANNGLWIVHNDEITELKADKQPVAFFENAAPFTNHVLDISPGSCIYLFTDGYADQFGGAGAKKYKTKTLKKFILSIYKRPVEDQVELLKENFITWKKELDQVDDVAIAIIRL